MHEQRRTKIQSLTKFEHGERVLRTKIVEFVDVVVVVAVVVVVVE